MANTHSIDLELSSSQYLSITDALQTGLDLTTDDFTFEAWIKIEQLPSTAGTNFTIVSKLNSDTNNRQYGMRINSATDKLFMFWYSKGDVSPITYDTWESDNAIVDSDDVGEWVHIAVAASPSGRTLKMFRNGSEVNATRTRNDNATTIHNLSAAFRIGAMSSAVIHSLFDGLIDEVRVWKEERTPAEISANYQKELTGSETNLVGYWKLNNSLLDETSNDNDLTNHNSASFSTDVPPWPTDVDISDTGSGADTLLTDKVFTTADIGSGLDTLFADKNFYILDDGSGIDAAIKSVEMLIQDSGSGLDAILREKIITILEIGTGSDTINIDKQLQILDTGSGLDAILIDKILTIIDTGTGIDVIFRDIIVDVTDTGAGIDALLIDHEIPIAEAGTGTDAVVRDKALTLTDTGSGVDAIITEALINILDSGSGVDNVCFASVMPRWNIFEWY